MAVKKVTVSMDADVLAKCDKMAGFRGLSRSAYLADLVRADEEVRMREVVLSREGFTRVLMDRLPDGKRKIGRAIDWVESALILQNDVGRPVYVLEVSGDTTSDDIAYIRQLMEEAGCVACLVPSGILGYVGMVSASSFGIGRDRQYGRDL